ncbi:MAG: hypothetical protein EOO88_20040, partial [Pedobacter sp.]
MFNPVSTYRIQFHKDFTLSDFEKRIPYFKKLGVSTIYASPLLAATPGSTHGYDTIDAQLINPEIGTLEQLKSITRQLKAEGISWLQDIVPNHMAYHPDNKWLMDVLEKGKSSPYYAHFDFVQPLNEANDAPLMVPFLGNPLEEIVDNGELKLEYANGKLYLNYFDSAYPVNAAGYEYVLGSIQNSSTNEQLQNFNKLENLEDAAVYSESFEKSLTHLEETLQKDETLTLAVDQQINTINDDKTLLSEIVGLQYYRLCHWQETDEQINFRRFFTVNGLICLNIHRKEVFNDYHELIDDLIKESYIQGVRVDHIDGLFKPEAYLKQLRELTGPETYIVAEKILEAGEAFPADWPIQGNTGYDFLAWVNNLFTRKDQEKLFTDFYQSFSGEGKPVHEQILEKKRFILSNYMKGEWKNLHKLFLMLNLATPNELSKIQPEDLKTAIGELLVHFPVYR